MFSYTVIGTGAVGGYYGSRLAESGKEVRFLARSDYDYIREKGLEVKSVHGDFILEDVSVYNNSSDIPVSDVLLVALKTTSNRSLVSLLKPLVRKDTIILILQNGLTMEDEVAQAFPDAVVIGGMCFICSQKSGPGRIDHMDFGSITMASFDNRGSDRLSILKDDFESSKIPITLAEDLGEARWRKLLWNIPYNGLSVVLDCDTRDIMTDLDSREIIRQLMVEVVAGARACGYTIEDEAIDKMLAYTDSMTPYEPSMKLDYNYKRSLEIEYMYRRPLDQASKNGVELPRIAMLASELAFIDRRNTAS